MRMRQSKFNPQVMKTKIILFGIMLSALTILFQNCAKIQNTQNSAKATIVGKISTESAVQALGAFGDHGPKLYYIHSNGRVDVGYYETTDFPIQANRCQLNSDQLAELSNYLQTESICFYESNAPAGSICTQQFIYPYFIVTSDGIKYEFGRISSGCSDTFELCGANRAPFKSFIQQISQELDQNCL